MNGILVINKKSGMTSRDVVNQVGKILHTKKVGHTGTLDPMATGVLVLCLGKATKIAELLTAAKKEYIAEVTLGIKTDTLDITGNIVEKKEYSVTKEQIESVLASLIGTYEQEVPLYSAVHVNGKKLYEYARKKETVLLPTRLVTIYSLELTHYSENKFVIRTTVSKGTYIRSLIQDIVNRLNTIGVMSQLERKKQGDFDIKDAITIEELKPNNIKLYSIEQVLQEYYSIEVDEVLRAKIKNGQLLYNQYQHSPLLFLYHKKAIALYHTYSKDKSYLKPWKMLE